MRVANVHQLTRIISYLSEVEFASKTEISIQTEIGGDYLSSAIAFLKGKKIIFIIKTSGNGRRRSVKYYTLNPLYKQ